jgi:hypothetical protein
MKILTSSLGFLPHVTSYTLVLPFNQHPKCILINISEKQFSGPMAQSLSSCQFVHPFSTQKKHTWKAVLWTHSPKLELILICSSSAQLVNLVYEYQHLMAFTLTFPSNVIRNLFSVLMKPDTLVLSKSFKVHLPFLWLINVLSTPWVTFALKHGDPCRSTPEESRRRYMTEFFTLKSYEL